MSYDVTAREKLKMHTLDRVIVLKTMEGKDPLTSAGLVDKRLFNGENNLHAIFDIRSGMWYLRYDNGVLPGALDVKYTELGPLLDFTRQYFSKRNVEVVEVKDSYSD